MISIDRLIWLRKRLEIRIAEINRTITIELSSLQKSKVSMREAEVLDLIHEHKCNKEIAVALGISTHTVKLHVRNLLRKLHARNRHEL